MTTNDLMNDQIIETKNFTHDSGIFKYRRFSTRSGLGKF